MKLFVERPSAAWLLTVTSEASTNCGKSMPQPRSVALDFGAIVESPMVKTLMGFWPGSRKERLFSVKR